MSGCNMRTNATPTVTLAPTVASPQTSSGGGALAGNVERMPTVVPNSQVGTTFQDNMTANVGPPISDPMVAAVVATNASVNNAANDWNQGWERVFQGLALAPDDITYLKNGNFSDAQLSQFADELSQQPLVDAAGNTAATSTGTSAGNVPAPSTGTDTTTTATGTPGWSKDWEQTFTDLKLDPADIKSLSTSGYTNEQLQIIATDLAKTIQADASKTAAGTDASTSAASTGTSGSTAAKGASGSGAGDWSPTWESKFRALMTEMKVPADQAEQVIQGIAQRGLKQSDLTAFYDEMSAQTPGWNSTWENKFKTLDLPAEMVKSLKAAGAPEKALKETFEKLLKTKLNALHNGRLKKLDEAGATSEEKWSVLMGNVNNKDFDKAVESIHGQHVPAWKRVLSVALNFIPGVNTLEYLTGKDWITGDKIDRSNPLNIGMAILSAIPAVGYIKGVAQGIKGATMLGTALRAGAAGTEAAVVGGGAVNTAAQIAGDSGKLATMLNAVKGGATTAEAVGISGKTATSLMRFGAEGLSTGDKLRKGLDIAKMALPGLNKIGMGKELLSVGKGYYQLSGYAAKFGAQLKGLESLGSEGDRLMKNLPSLSRTSESDLVQKLASLTADGKGGTKAFTVAERQLADLRKVTEVTGLKPAEIRTIAGKVMPALEGKATSFKASGKYWHLNPTKTQATASLAAAKDGSGLVSRVTTPLMGGGGTLGMDTVKLGRGISVGSGGVMGTADFANVTSALTGTRIGEVGTQLGVGAGSKFRVLAQIKRLVNPGSEQVIMNDASAIKHSGSTLYNGTRWAVGGLNRTAIAPSVTMLGVGLVSGQTRSVTDQAWDYWKTRDARNAEEVKIKAGAEAKFKEEQRQLDAAQAQMNAEAAASGTGTGTGDTSASGTGTGDVTAANAAGTAANDQQQAPQGANQLVDVG